MDNGEIFALVAAERRRPADMFDGLRLRATDLDWSAGDGPEVAGPGEALALAMTGRGVALADLSGEGVAVLEARRA